MFVNLKRCIVLVLNRVLDINGTINGQSIPLFAAYLPKVFLSDYFPTREAHERVDSLYAKIRFA